MLKKPNGKPKKLKATPKKEKNNIKAGKNKERRNGTTKKMKSRENLNIKNQKKNLKTVKKVNNLHSDTEHDFYTFDTLLNVVTV